MSESNISFLKRFCMVWAILCACLTLHAQQGWWTWMHGDNTSYGPGYYGTQGIPRPTNDPGASYAACSWTDLSGNFWLFGGSGSTNTLWMFNPSTGMWTWMKGDTTANSAGTYGTQGIPAPSNNPGARGLGIVSWTDQTGNLWMFGGDGMDAIGYSGLLGDLWRYNISTNMWTWMSGSNLAYAAGSYGTLGVAAATNQPPSRCECSASWVDATGNLWMFGGSIASGEVNDMWKFDVSANMWTWMHGSNTLNPPGSYGIKGVASPTNDPPGRDANAKFKDASGNFWLFGGVGNSGIYNDMWKFDPLAGMWTWMSGSNMLGDTGSTGLNCIPNSSNQPTCRFENRASWTDACGNFYVFGGMSWNISISLDYSDLWYYNPVSNVWTLVNGNSTPNLNGSWGGLNVPAASNIPNGRCGSVPFSGQDGSLWLFGGLGTTVTWNDLWRYVPDTTCGNVRICPLPLKAGFSSNTQTGCAPLNVNFVNLCTGASVYSWNFGDGTTSNANSPVHTYANSGTYTVSLIAFQGSTTDTLIRTAYITVLPVPVAMLSVASDSVCTGMPMQFTNTSTGATSYSWNFGDGVNTTLTAPAHSWLNTGTYSITLVATNNGGCSDTARLAVTVLSPLPVSVSFREDSTLSCNSTAIQFTATVVNATHILWSFGDGSSSVQSNPIHAYSIPGNYMIHLTAYGKDPCGPDTVTVSKSIDIPVDSCKLIIPNVFSPDGDGQNDIYYITAVGYTGFQINIFDRWGKSVFTSNDKQIQWNGKIQNTGDEAAEGTYYYMLTLTNADKTTESYRGFLSLTRNK